MFTSHEHKDDRQRLPHHIQRVGRHDQAVVQDLERIHIGFLSIGLDLQLYPNRETSWNTRVYAHLFSGHAQNVKLLFWAYPAGLLNNCRWERQGNFFAESSARHTDSWRCARMDGPWVSYLIAIPRRKDLVVSGTVW